MRKIIKIRIMLFALSLFVCFPAASQYSKNQSVNEIIPAIERSIRKNEDRQFGTLDQADKLGQNAVLARMKKILENSFISVSSRHTGSFDYIEFMVHVCSEDELKTKWLPKALSLSKEFKFKDRGAQMIYIQSGASKPGRKCLIFDLTSYEFAFSTTGSNNLNTTKQKYTDTNDIAIGQISENQKFPTKTNDVCSKALASIGKNKKARVERQGKMEPYLDEDASLIDSPVAVPGFAPTGPVVLVRQEVAIGASSAMTSAELIICEGGKLRSLYQIGSNGRSGGTLLVEGGQVVARTFTWTDNDPNCCPSLAEDRVLTMVNGQVTAGPAVRKRLPK